MANQISLQADVASAPNSAISLLGAAQPLLKALSADNVNPLAVLQVEAIGSCFHSNGEWAARLPDLLSRTSSVRLERLSAWIGWQKGDTASYLSQTSGGRTASLICLFLGNIYPAERCGLVLHRLSSVILPQGKRNASFAQLSDVTQCLSGKLACLGFGNLLALHLSRIRQCLFESGQAVPLDLVSMPTEETMEEFLLMLHKALQDESLVLHFVGSRGAGPLLASLMCLCPEDVKVEVEGELIQRGQRNSIIFSISGNENGKTEIYLESIIRPNSEDLSTYYIKTVQHGEQLPQLKFHWSGWLSSYLSNGLAQAGSTGNLSTVCQALSNLIAASIMSVAQSRLSFSKVPGQPFKPLLGPRDMSEVYETLKMILKEPFGTNDRDIKSAYTDLKNSVAVVLPFSTCSCGLCDQLNPWLIYGGDFPESSVRKKRWVICRHASLWRTLGRAFEYGLLSTLIKTESNSVVSSPDLHARVVLSSLPRAIGSYFSQNANTQSLPPIAHYEANDIHRSLCSFAGRHEEGSICSSSSSSTIFPSTIQYPQVSYPWAIRYFLVDGRLHDGSNVFYSIKTTTEERGTRPTKLGKRVKSSTVSSKIIPSAIGEHFGFTMTLRPDVSMRQNFLRLRSVVQYSATQSFEINFLEAHLGFMKLLPTDDCEHYQRTPLQDAGVFATTVDRPSAAKGLTAVTMTYWNPEAQFLCCNMKTPALYHVNCCLECAVAQARKKNIKLIIGGKC